ncbi:MAG: hypothetical protein J2P37_10330 [Ktedonobacteraceae bacterium]|nr:hypothetical protein [Ktedonobacteraceae bacterium]
MLSAVITALLLVVMPLIVAYLLWSARREQRRHNPQQAACPSLPSHPLDRHVTAVLYLQDGKVVNVEKPKGFVLPSSWYARRRVLVSLGLLMMLLLAFFIQDGLAGGPVSSFTKGITFSLFRTNNSGDSRVQMSAHMTASQRLVRGDSTDRRQYHTDYQYQVWSWSSCSGFAMAEVMNSYGLHLIAADVLQRELDLGVWSTQLGLLGDDGIMKTVATYGFNTDYGHQRDLQAVIDIANKGFPVIVGIRDAVLFPGGHIFVVRGGDGQYVYTVDSSSANFQRMTRPQFQGMWSGFSAIVTPRN